MKNRLKDLRCREGLTQKQVAEILCMSQTGYSKYETGDCNVPIWVLISLTNLYHVNIDYILGLTEYDKFLPRLCPVNE